MFLPSFLGLQIRSIVRFVKKILGLSFFERFFILLPLLSYVPDLAPTSVIFYLYFIVDFSFFFLNQRIHFKSKVYSILLFLFLSILTISLIWGIFYDVGISNWARGILPFIFLITWFFVQPNIDITRFYKMFLLSSYIWVIKILIDLLSFLLSDSIASILLLRLTFISSISVIPYNLVVIPILLFNNKIVSSKLRFFLLTLFSLLTIWEGYRIQLLIIVIIYLFYFLPKFIYFLFKPYTYLLLFALISLSYFITQNNDFQIFSSNISRFNELKDETESGRVLELRYAISKFIESPLVGKGIGFQVPTEHITFGIDEKLTEDFPPTVGYVHNFPGYFLMDTGIVGFLFYVLVIFYLPFSYASFIPNWVILTYILFFVFVLVEATFRLIHFNLIVIFFQYLFWRYHRQRILE